MVLIRAMSDGQNTGLFSNNFKVAFDVKTQNIHFYSFFKTPEKLNEFKCEPHLVPENEIGLPKAHVEHCSNNSVFDQLRKKHDP